MKNFDDWNILKKKINLNEKIKYPKEREIWWCSVGLNIGVEIDGKNNLYERPILIFKKYNKDSVHIIPISSKIFDGRYSFIFEFENKIQNAIISQNRLIDTKRLIRKIGLLNKKLVC